MMKDRSNEHHSRAITALVIDVGTGRVRLGSIQAADEAMALGVRLLAILRNATAAT